MKGDNPPYWFDNTVMINSDGPSNLPLIKQQPINLDAEEQVLSLSSDSLDVSSGKLETIEDQRERMQNL